MQKWTVKYEIMGQEYTDSSGPYDTLELAQEHREDIAGFEGVENVRLELIDVPEQEP